MIPITHLKALEYTPALSMHDNLYQGFIGEAQPSAWIRPYLLSEIRNIRCPSCYKYRNFGNYAACRKVYLHLPSPWGSPPPEPPPLIPRASSVFIIYRPASVFICKSDQVGMWNIRWGLAKCRPSLSIGKSFSFCLREGKFSRLPYE